MERAAACALACPYGENYPSSSDFRWIPASNSPDLAGAGRGGHFRLPAERPQSESAQAGSPAPPQPRKAPGRDLRSAAPEHRRCPPCSGGPLSAGRSALRSPLAPGGSGAQPPQSAAAAPAANAPRSGCLGTALPPGCCARGPAGRSGGWQSVGQAAQPRCSSAPAERGARRRAQRFCGTPPEGPDLALCSCGEKRRPGG